MQTLGRKARFYYDPSERSEYVRVDDSRRDGDGCGGRSNTVKHQFGEFTLDWDGRQLLREGGPVHLSPKGLELLRVLLDCRPRAVSKLELHERLWPDTFVSDATLTSLVAEVRRALGDEAGQGRFVRTVQRFGYAFCADAVEQAIPIPDNTAKRVHCWLTWDSGQAALREGENILGRDRTAAVWFDSIEVSRRHARISIVDEEAALEDLESRNGTFVRGERVTSAVKLQNGDRIELGSIAVTFRIAQANASTKSRIPSRRSAKRSDKKERSA
jgi:DNA-binding winged helix-turn-helix (wHTH) protein